MKKALLTISAALMTVVAILTFNVNVQAAPKTMPDGTVFDAFVPEIYGKERRKTVGGKEGLLGVEGIQEDMIMDALKKSGAEVCGVKSGKRAETPIVKSDLYALGLSGRENSHILRKELLKELSLPSKMSSNMLLSVINRILTMEELSELVDKIKKM